MIKKYFCRKGFTLIEVLVVVAIIGILAGIVLVFLGSARSKAKDTRIISDVKQIRETLESNNKSGYPDLVNDTDISLGGTQILGGLVADGNPGTTSINILLGDAFDQGGAINVVNTPNTANDPVTAYAIYGLLPSSVATPPSLYFCLDSTGNSNLKATLNTGAVCPP